MKGGFVRWNLSLCRMKTILVVSLLLIISFSAHVWASDAGPCEFDRNTLQFAGSPIDQAKCLLRPVLIRGKLGEHLSALPKAFECVGATIDIPKQKFRTFLSASKIDPALLGGDIDDDLARTSGGQIAAYFVIHDTSTPNFSKNDFPADVDWLESVNNLSIWRNGSKSRAHVFVNRKGESTTALNFLTPWRATKFESGFGNTALRGLFVHVELIQPRRSDPRLAAGNDAIAPAIGFTAAQYERLAVVYLAASVRRGTCLIPTYHSVLDTTLPDGHDDPQNFSLSDFASALDRVRSAIRAQ